MPAKLPWQMAAVNHKVRAYRHIRKKLLYGELGARRSFSDKTLASELGMSRTPIREAILQLEIEGLLQRAPRSGTNPRRMSSAEYEELLDLRELIEGYAAARAAQRATAEHLVAMERACRNVQAAAAALRNVPDVQRDVKRDSPLWTRVIQADIAFHRALVAASRTRWVPKFLDGWQVLNRVFQFSRELPPIYSALGEAARVYRDHRRIHKAVQQHDGDLARQLITRHLRVSRVGPFI